MRFVGLHWIRSRQRALARGALALFCLVWLQAALLPCAMAVVPGGMGEAQEEYCAYCPPAGSHHDDGVGVDCAYPDGPQVDSRGPVLAPLIVALPTVACLLETRAPDTALFPDDARPPGRVGPPLAISYCRFLK